MAHNPNKLLMTLSALGLAATLNAGNAEAAARYDSFAEFFSYTRASLNRSVDAKADFVRAYPRSEAARRVARELTLTLRSLPPAQQRAVMDRIAAAGGLPREVAELTGLGTLGTSSIGQGSTGTSTTTSTYP